MATDRHRLVRLVRCVRGEMTLRRRHRAPVRLRPAAPRDCRSPSTARCSRSRRARADAARVREPGDERLAHAAVERRRRARDARRCRPGRCAALVLESAADGPPREMPVGRDAAAVRRDRAFWRGWLARSTYRAAGGRRWSRSAITLKLMTYAPPAAWSPRPTAGLPEQVGGERNWDYRYTWIRDASFSVYALLGSGSPTRPRRSGAGCGTGSRSRSAGERRAR